MGGANYIILLLGSNWCDQESEETTLWQIACLHVHVSLTTVKDNQLISYSYTAHIGDPTTCSTQLVTY